MHVCMCCMHESVQLTTAFSVFYFFSSDLKFIAAS